MTRRPLPAPASTGWGEWDGAVHLLSAPFLACKAAPFIDHERHEIRWHELLHAAGPWSSGEQLFVQLALALWNGDARPDLNAAVNFLDDDTFTLFMQALAIARGLHIQLVPAPREPRR